MTDETLSQAAIDSMLASAAADGPEALGPRPTKSAAMAKASSVEELFKAPVLDQSEGATNDPGGSRSRESHVFDEPAEEHRPANIVSIRAEPEELIDRAAMEAIERRLDSLDQLLSTLRGDSAEARRAEEQVRALQEQVRSLDGEVRFLQKRIDSVDRRLASIQRRPATRARRSLWSTSLYVDAVENGRWRTGGRQ